MATSPKPPVGRPKRFDIELPVEFRPHDSDRWWQAKTENISANGVLFRAKKQLPPLTPVDVKLQLPSSLTGEGTVRLLCSGYVVRSEGPDAASGESKIAATIQEYQLANGKPGPAADLRQAQFLAMRGDVAKLVHRLNTLLFIVIGHTELVLIDPGNEDNVRSFALKTQQAAEEAAGVVRSLAKMLK